MKAKAKTNLVLREIKESDCIEIYEAFCKLGWQKPIALYKKYLEYQEQGIRDIIIAELDHKFVGYLTINWLSDYKPFQLEKIPEIVDFNVLPVFRRRGIGTALMDEAERRIKRISNFAGIGFGLFEDYGAAQILYVKRGYIPDGNGIVNNLSAVKYGDKITVDDDTALYLTKKLN